MGASQACANDLNNVTVAVNVAGSFLSSLETLSGKKKNSFEGIVARSPLEGLRPSPHQG